jgi:hypothetical protein
MNTSENTSEMTNPIQYYLSRRADITAGVIIAIREGSLSYRYTLHYKVLRVNKRSLTVVECDRTGQPHKTAEKERLAHCPHWEPV